MLWSYDWISIPLVYTQVVTLATYSFFAVALIARQYIDGKEKQFQLQIDIYIPVFTILQFFFFMGLLKVYVYMYSIVILKLNQVFVCICSLKKTELHFNRWRNN